jgi:peroxiredoxin
MLYRSFRQLLPAALLLMKLTPGECAPASGSPIAQKANIPLLQKADIPLPQKTDASFTLKGLLTAPKYPIVLYLDYQSGGKSIHDSAIVNDGHFIFKGSLSQPIRARLFRKRPAGSDNVMYSHYEERPLYLEPGIITVKSKGSLAEAAVTGSPSTAVADEWEKIDKPYIERMKDVRGRAYYNRGNRDSVRILDEALHQQLLASAQAMAALVARYPDAYASRDMVYDRRFGLEPEIIEPSFKVLSPKFRDSKEGRDLAAQIASVKQALIGVHSPDFIQSDVQGRSISLSSFRGKYVLVDFWASWCGICRAENPNVLRAYNAYKDSGFTVLGVSLDDSSQKDKWLQAIKEDNMPWQQVSDLKGRDNSAAVLYGIKGIPQNVLLDPNGVIIAKNLRDRDLMSKLMEIFAGGRNMRLDGFIASLKDSMAVFCYYAGDKPKQDTVAIHDGSFIWQTVMPEPQKIRVMLVPSHHMLQFYSDIGYLELSGQADSLDNLKVKGSWLDGEAKAFAASIKDTSGQKKQRSLRIKYIHAHPQTLLSLSLVGDMMDEGSGEVYPLYMSLTETLRGTPTGHRIAALLIQHNPSNSTQLK